MKTKLLAAGVVALLATPAAALAEVMVLRPDRRDLYDLNHYYYYTWGLRSEVDLPGLRVTGAALAFDNIRNWNARPNVLYVHLLDAAPEGITRGYDRQGGGDNFAGQGVELVTYRNLPRRPQDLLYRFTDDEVAAFNEYLGDGGDVALGFDPDCHFWNDGVSLTLCYQVIPEPGAVAPLVAGALLLLRRRGA